MKRRILAAVIAVITAFSLTACGSKSENPPQADTSGNRTMPPVSEETTPQNTENTTDVDVDDIDGLFDFIEGQVNNKHNGDSIENTPLPCENPEIYGNTSGNIKNGGYIAEKDGWIYYQNSSDNGYLYKVRADGSDKKLIIEDKSKYINVIGDWIYYQNESENGYLFKIRADGSERTQLEIGSSSYINVVGDWIYFVREDGIFKIKTDGTERTQITKDACYGMIVKGDWIFYTTAGGRISKIRIDGTGENSLGVKGAWYDVSDDGEWIYYYEINTSLYKVRADGSEKLQLNSDKSYNINVSGDWIYYCSNDEGGYIFKIRPDGSEKTQLNDDKSCFGYFINITNDWIYYLYDRTIIKKMSVDGKYIQAVD